MMEHGGYLQLVDGYTYIIIIIYTYSSVQMGYIMIDMGIIVSEWDSIGYRVTKWKCKGEYHGKHLILIFNDDRSDQEQ